MENQLLDAPVIQIRHDQFIPTYVSAIPRNVRLENGKPVYDAYLIKDSGGPGPLNGCAPRLAAGDPRIIMRRPDSDATGDQFRRYELPGSSHFDVWHFMYRPPIKEISTCRAVLSIPR